MADRYINPDTGNDSNDGSQAHPWKSLANISTLTAVDTLYIDTTTAPLWMDRRLAVAGWTAIGIGVLNMTMRNMDGSTYTVSGLADLRPYKQIAGTWTQPNAGTYPNLWQSTDTTGAVDNAPAVWRLAGWGADAQPLAWLDRKTAASAAAVYAAVNGAANSFYSDGSVILIYSATDPNSNGVVYARTLMPIVDAIYVTAGGSVRNIACGGTAKCRGNATGLATSGSYALKVEPASSTTSTVTNCWLYCGGDHTTGINSGAGSPVGSVVNFTNVRYEQCPPWSGYTSTTDVWYYGGGSGNTIVYDHVYGAIGVGTVGQNAVTELAAEANSILGAHGGGNTSAASATVKNSYLHGTVADGNDLMMSAIAFERTYIRYPNCATPTTYTYCWMHGMPQAITGCTPSITVDSCLVQLQYSGYQPNGYGTYVIRDSILDGSNHNIVGTAAGFLVATAAINATVTNNIILESSAAGGNWINAKPLSSLSSTRDAFVLSGNRYYGQYPAVTSVCHLDGALRDLAYMQGIGQEVGSTALFSTAAYMMVKSLIGVPGMTLATAASELSTQTAKILSGTPVVVLGQSQVGTDPGAAAQLATDQAGAPAAKRTPDTAIGGVAGTLDIAADNPPTHDVMKRSGGMIDPADVLNQRTGTAAGGTATAGGLVVGNPGLS